MIPAGGPAPVGADPTAARRHPQDPDPTRSTKAIAVVWLAAVGLLFSPVVAGALPAGFALLLARSTEAEMRASGGFLTGVAPLRVGTRLARLALLVAVAVIVVGIVFAIFQFGGSDGGAGVRYGSDVN